LSRSVFERSSTARRADFSGHADGPVHRSAELDAHVSRDWDATAFGRVMNHFDVLKQAIAAEDGALVKTIGDAVMAVFRQPENALRAMLKAQRVLAEHTENPLTLKAGMHLGPCI